MGFLFSQPKMQSIPPPPPVTKEDAEKELKKRNPFLDYILTSAGGLSALGGKKRLLGE